MAKKTTDVVPEPEGEFWKRYAENMPNPEDNPAGDPRAIVKAKAAQQPEE